MNLYFRLLRILLQTFFVKDMELLDESHSYFRVLPLDCDFNLHLTNSRYPAFMDLARTQFASKLGMLKRVFFGKGWFPVVASCELTYLKPIKPFRRFRVTSKFIAFDEKYFFMQHQFFVKNKLHAFGLIKGVFVSVKSGKQVLPTEVFEVMGIEPVALPTPEMIKCWQALNTAKRQWTEESDNV